MMMLMTLGAERLLTASVEYLGSPVDDAVTAPHKSLAVGRGRTDGGQLTDATLNRTLTASAPGLRTSPT
jgi:hypothetical protein